jgi:C-terminal processing protease CtpA/Prc
VNCKDNTEEQNKYVNDWIYSNMDYAYYWNTTLSASKISYQNPKDYFKTLIYKDDRFSAIFESYTDIYNELNGVSAADIGFNFKLWKESSTNDNVLGEVLYVKPGTPAQSLGIKRGDMFRKVNGTQMTMTNYSKVIDYLFDSSASSSVTFSIYQNGAFTDKTAITVNKASNYNEDPLFMDTVYTIQNKKIGYMVYNFFTNDGGNGSMKYDLELNSTIGKFKAQNISELIVDLRYNHGGMMTSAINLGSMLVPNLASDKVFTLTEYNQNLTEYFNSTNYTGQHSDNPFVSNFATSINATYPTATSTPVQNVGNNLTRIFFLTGTGTASASEMVINGLKPYMPIVLIGDTTVGKNVGSTLIHDEDNKTNLWAFMPIILKYFNKDHYSDFTKGFAPDYRILDDTNYEMGDIHEGQLAKAIFLITGIQPAQTKAAAVKRVKVTTPIEFRRIRNGLIMNNKSLESYLNRIKK